METKEAHRLKYFLLNADASNYLQAFNVVFSKAIAKSEASDDLKERVANLTDTTTYSIFQYTTRGLFECDKLTFTAQVALQVC